MHKRSECVGCGLCTETAPDYWCMNDDGEAQLRDIRTIEGPYECCDAIQNDRERIIAAATGCPVNVIRAR